MKNSVLNQSLKKNNPNIKFAKIRNGNKKTLISFKIIVIVSITIIFLMLAVDGIVYALTYNKIYGMNKDNMKIVTSEMCNNFENMMLVQSSDTDKIAEDPYIQSIAKKENQSTRQDVLLKEQDLISEIKDKIALSTIAKEDTENIFFAGKDGITVVCTNDDYLGYDNSHYQYVNNVLQEGKNAISSVYTSVMTSKPVITFVSPVKDEAGNTIGVVGKTIFIDYFSKRFKKFKYMNDGYVSILDQNNNIVYHPQNYYINKKNEVKEIKQTLSSKNFFEKQSSNFIQFDFNNKTYIGNISSIPQLKLAIILMDEKEEIKSIPEKLGIIILVITLIAVAAVILILNFIIRNLFKPMNVLIKNTKEIAKGNLTVSNKIVRLDEVGKISKSFNEMTANIKVLLMSIKEVSDEVMDTNNSVKKAQSSVVQGMDIISVDMDRAKQNTFHISENLDASFDAFNNIRTKIAGIKNLSKGMLNLSNSIQKVNDTGIKRVKELANMSGISKKSIREVGDSFDELTKSVSEIKNIVNVVSEISNKTHVLGLNAAIEAARVGNSGNSFGVIAGEIRTLSLNIESEMENISEIINKINIKTNNTGTKMQYVDEVFNKEIEIVNNTIENYKNIFNLSIEITSSIKNIDVNLEAVNIENDGVYNKLNEINNLYKEFNDVIGKVSCVIEEQYQYVNEMDTTLKNMNHITSQLDSNVNKFVV